MLPPKNPIRIFNIKYSDKTRRRVHELVDHVLDEAFLTNHTLCRDLENLVNSKQKTKYSACTTSATTGLEVIFRTINVKKKAVLVQANTFIATAHAIQASGGIIVPYDLDNQFVASLEDIKDAYMTCINQNIEVGALCIVHIAGRASKDLFKIRAFCKDLNIPLVEDNAQGFLSKLENQYLGCIGDYSVTSFQTTKVVACGEGGIISCNSENLISHIKNNIFYGKSENLPRLFDKESGNFKLSEINAALVIADLERSEERINRRKYIDDLYKSNVKSDLCSYVNSPISNEPSFYKTLFLARNIEIREKIEEFFKINSIAMTGAVYREPLNIQPRVLNSKNYINRELKNTNKFTALHFAPPNYPELSDSEVMNVIQALNNCKL